MKPRRAPTRALLLALLMCGAEAAVAQNTPPPEQTEEQPKLTPADEPAAVTPTIEETEPEVVISLTPPLLAPAATLDERAASAKSLVAASELAPLRAALAGEAGNEAAEAARTAIATAGSAATLALLTEAALDANNPAGMLCVTALETAGTRDALRELVRILQSGTESNNEALTALAARSLERASGRGCDPKNTSPWLEWWGEVEWLPETEWQTRLAEGFKARWHETISEREAYAGRTESLYRRLFSELPPEGRTALLGEMLTSERRSVRLVGLELIERSLLNGRPVDPSLAAPTATALNDPSPHVRQLAARSLARFAPGASRAAAIESLKVEADPATAATLLDLIASGEANATTSELAEPWLAEPGPAANAAARLIYRAITNGQSPGSDFEERVQQRTRGLVDAAPSPPTIRLLAVFGSDSDLPRIAAAITSTNNGVVSAAVRALTLMPGGYAQLESLAHTQPELRTRLADLVSRQASDLVAYQFIRRLENLPIDERNGAMGRVWSGLDAHELLPAARETASPEFRSTILSQRLLSEGTPLPRDTKRDLIILYAESLAEAGMMANVLTAIGMLDSDEQPTLGSTLATAALQRLVESGSQLPTPSVCSPLVWVNAIASLSESAPAISSTLLQNPLVRAHISSDDAAETAILAIIDSGVLPVIETENNDSEPQASGQDDPES